MRRLTTALGGLAIAGGALLATAAPALAAPAEPTDTTSDQATETSSAEKSEKSEKTFTPPPATASDEALAYENAEGGGGPSSDPAAIDGEAPTPAAEGAPYGDELGGPEIAGVPLQGTLNSIERSTSILPGSGPGDYA